MFFFYMESSATGPSIMHNHGSNLSYPLQPKLAHRMKGVNFRKYKCKTEQPWTDDWSLQSPNLLRR